MDTRQLQSLLSPLCESSFQQLTWFAFYVTSIFYGCCNKVPHTRFLEITVYCLLVLKARVGGQGVSRSVFLFKVHILVSFLTPGSWVAELQPSHSIHLCAHLCLISPYKRTPGILDHRAPNSNWTSSSLVTWYPYFQWRAQSEVLGLGL